MKTEKELFEEKELLKKGKKMGWLSFLISLFFFICAFIAMSFLKPSEDDKPIPLNWEEVLLILSVLIGFFMGFIFGANCMLIIIQIQNYKLYGEFNIDNSNSEDHPGGGL